MSNLSDKKEKAFKKVIEDAIVALNLLNTLLQENDEFREYFENRLDLLSNDEDK